MDNLTFSQSQSQQPLYQANRSSFVPSNISSTVNNLLSAFGDVGKIYVAEKQAERETDARYAKLAAEATKGAVLEKAAYEAGDNPDKAYDIWANSLQEFKGYLDTIDGLSDEDRMSIESTMRSSALQKMDNFTTIRQRQKQNDILNSVSQAIVSIQDQTPDVQASFLANAIDIVAENDPYGDKLKSKQEVMSMYLTQHKAALFELPSQMQEEALDKIVNTMKIADNSFATNKTTLGEIASIREQISVKRTAERQEAKAFIEGFKGTVSELNSYLDSVGVFRPNERKLIVSDYKAKQEQNISKSYKNMLEVAKYNNAMSISDFANLARTVYKDDIGKYDKEVKNYVASASIVDNNTAIALLKDPTLINNIFGKEVVDSDYANTITKVAKEKIETSILQYASRGNFTQALGLTKQSGVDSKYLGNMINQQLSFNLDDIAKTPEALQQAQASVMNISSLRTNYSNELSKSLGEDSYNKLVYMDALVRGNKFTADNIRNYEEYVAKADSKTKMANMKEFKQGYTDKGGHFLEDLALYNGLRTANMSHSEAIEIVNSTVEEQSNRYDMVNIRGYKGKLKDEHFKVLSEIAKEFSNENETIVGITYNPKDNNFYYSNNTNKFFLKIADPEATIKEYVDEKASKPETPFETTSKQIKAGVIDPSVQAIGKLTQAQQQLLIEGYEAFKKHTRAEVPTSMFPMSEATEEEKKLKAEQVKRFVNQ